MVGGLGGVLPSGTAAGRAAVGRRQTRRGTRLGFGPGRPGVRQRLPASFHDADRLPPQGVGRAAPQRAPQLGPNSGTSTTTTLCPFLKGSPSTVNTLVAVVQQVTVRPLDWLTFSQCDDGGGADGGLDADVVLASDVVYDPELIAALVATLGRLLRSDKSEALVACTVRNEDTLQQFLDQLGALLSRT